uniref:Uncharacterized protein n=1 Tax=Ditylenchus dipsaci TaxID=166011 RepID=A0A915DGF6_9BILA
MSFSKPSEQCMSTGGQNTAVTPTPCVAPANSAGIIIDVNPATQINSMGTALGTCPCSNGLVQSFFADGGNNQANAIAALDVQCTDIANNFCVCGVNGLCYTAMGSLTDVQFYSSCTNGVCNMYTLLITNQPTDGIVSNDGGTSTFTFQQQLDANGNPILFNPNTNPPAYLRAASVSCGGVRIFRVPLALVHSQLQPAKKESRPRIVL